ncbi:MAG: hypothetical protein LBU35_03425 [Holosporales bacterium]|jgi:hypothetical protein|nr:hypothetical protein [Holosporales bacterium]
MKIKSLLIIFIVTLIQGAISAEVEGEILSELRDRELALLPLIEEHISEIVTPCEEYKCPTCPSSRQASMAEEVKKMTSEFYQNVLSNSRFGDRLMPMVDSLLDEACFTVINLDGSLLKAGFINDQNQIRMELQSPVFTTIKTIHEVGHGLEQSLRPDYLDEKYQGSWEDISLFFEFKASELLQSKSSYACRLTGILWNIIFSQIVREAFSETLILQRDAPQISRLRESCQNFMEFINRHSELDCIKRIPEGSACWGILKEQFATIEKYFTDKYAGFQTLELERDANGWINIKVSYQDSTLEQHIGDYYITGLANAVRSFSLNIDEVLDSFKNRHKPIERQDYINMTEYLLRGLSS